MSALGESFGNDGPLHEFKLRDSEGNVVKTYSLQLIGDDVKEALEKRIFERARNLLFSLRGGMSEEIYERRLAKLADDYMEGFFSPFTSDEGHKYLKTRQGALQLMALIFQCSEAEAGSLGADPKNKAELDALIRVVLQESFRGIDMKKVEEHAAKEKLSAPQGNLPLARTPEQLASDLLRMW